MQPLRRFIHGVDRLSLPVGHAFAWCAAIPTLGTVYEALVRYALNDPISWALDMSYLMYAGVFYMAGAYTLSRGAHVRADMLYRLWRPRTQAAAELAVYVAFFFPGEHCKSHLGDACRVARGNSRNACAIRACGFVSRR